MRTIVLAAKTPQEWAKTGENNATALTLNVAADLALWPDGTPQATFYRPDGVVYPIPCTISGATVSVPLTSTETTTAGRAQIEIQWIDTGVLAKSATFSGNIMQSLSEPGDVPAEPGQAWLDEVTAVGAATGAARDEAQGYAASMDTAIAEAIAPVTSQLAEITAEPEMITPTLLNGWVDFGSPYADVRYYKDHDGLVHLIGLIKSGTMFVEALVLTDGCRPSGALNFPTVSNNQFGSINITADGKVIPAVGSNDWISLSNITFKAA